jgi:hypothetical protein
MPTRIAINTEAPNARPRIHRWSDQHRGAERAAEDPSLERHASALGEIEETGRSIGLDRPERGPRHRQRNRPTQTGAEHRNDLLVGCVRPAAHAPHDGGDHGDHCGSKCVEESELRTETVERARDEPTSGRAGVGSHGQRK